MKTSKPLKQLVPEVLDYIKKESENQVIYNTKLLDIYDGQLLKYVEESMQLELKPDAYERAKERIAPINVLRKITEKQSRTYTKPASRSMKNDNDIDKEILESYEVDCKMDQKLQYASEILNLCKYVALEPFVHEGRKHLRVLTPKEFLVYSDSKIDPHTPTVFIKFMGEKKKVFHKGTGVDRKGNKKENANDVVRNVAMYHLYSTTEFVEVDSTGEILRYKKHNLGMLPFVYVKNTHNGLLPTPDSDNFAMAILIPKLLSDLNYAVQFMSHSILYGIDVDPSGLDGNPDSFWVIKSDEGEGKKPEIGTIDPKVDSDKVISLIGEQIRMWLDTKGLKTSGVNMDVSASGIAKIIDEADATSLRDKQLSIWADAERELWELISLLHSEWTSGNLLADKSVSATFEVDTEFQEQKPIIDKDAVADRVIKLYKEGLMTLKGAIKEMYPDSTELELEEKVKELEEYLENKRKNNPVNNPVTNGGTNTEDTNGEGEN